jgi:hypothetical protein
MRKCAEYDSPIDPNSLSFEQRLIDDTDFCRTCFVEWTPFLENGFSIV